MNGGLDIAAVALFDATVAWHVEFDRAPSLILAHHFPDVPNYGDVTQCDWASMPPVDIITGGSPCQDLSAAGRRAGMTEGTRSNLWVNMREAIATIRPSYVIWENVLGALSASAASASDMVADAGPLGNPGGGHLRALGRVLGDLAEIGYDARWTTVRASDVGAPHHRARVFLLATPTDREVNTPRDDRDFAAERGRAVPADTDSIRRREGAEQSVAGAPEVAAVVGDLGALPGYGRADDLLVLPTPMTAYSGRSPEEWRIGRPAGNGATRDRIGDLEVAMRELVDDVLVLPTPVAHPSGNTPENHLRKKPGRRQVTDLAILVENDLRELPPQTALDGGPGTSHVNSHVPWGRYSAAIRRWESVLGRPAPAPTELNRNGKPRLNAEFASWMMGLPEGWVTAPGIGISRAEQLKAIGNGVCPQQAAAALRALFAMPAGEAA